jgi:methylaspartate ammonia-lyase
MAFDRARYHLALLIFIHGGVPASSGKLLSVDVQAISDFIDRLQGQLPQLPLDAEEYGTIEAQIATIESQFSAPYPQPALLREPLLSIKAILAEAAE